MHSVIVGGGPIISIDDYRQLLEKADEIVCADGGLRYLDMLDMLPSIIIGDFDSVDQSLLDKYKHQGVSLEQFPIRKDATDSELTIDYVISRKPSQVTLIGMTGARIDHGLANILMLRKFFDKDIPAVILDDHNKIYFGRGNMTIQGSVGEMLSIIPISKELHGVKTIGLDYPLNDEILYNDRSRGVSNVIKTGEVKINTVLGDFLIILSRD